MMKRSFFGKCARLPAFHARRQHRDQIDSAALYWSVTADALETFTAKQLAGARDVLDTDKAIIVAHVPFLERSSGQAQTGVHGKFAQQKFKIPFIEGHIAIQAPDEVIIQPFDS